MKLREIIALGIALLLILALTMKKFVASSVTARNVVRDWKDLAAKYSVAFQIPTDVILAQICVESSGDPAAMGHDTAGSVGLMQVTDGAISDFNRWYHKQYTKADASDASRPWINIEIGTGYLKGVQSYYVKSHKLEDAIQAYNGGAGLVGQPVVLEYLSRVLAYRTLIVPLI